MYDNSEAKLLSYVFVEQGLSATLASGSLGHPSIVDFDAHGLTMTTEDSAKMKAYSMTVFDTSSGIGPSAHSEQMEWWG